MLFLRPLFLRVFAAFIQAEARRACLSRRAEGLPELPEPYNYASEQLRQEACFLIP